MILACLDSKTISKIKELEIITKKDLRVESLPIIESFFAKWERIDTLKEWLKKNQ